MSNIDERLKDFVDRIENVEGEISALSSDRKEIYAEAKGVGYDPKIVRKIIAIRKQDKDDRDEEAALIDSYLGSLGML